MNNHRFFEEQNRIIEENNGYLKGIIERNISLLEKQIAGTWKKCPLGAKQKLESINLYESHLKEWKDLLFDLTGNKPITKGKQPKSGHKSGIVLTNHELRVIR